MARPELLDKREAWAGGKLNATTLLLEPLTADETEQLIAAVLDGAPIGRCSSAGPSRGRSLSTIVASLADVYYRVGDVERAEAEARRAAELGATDDVITQVLSLQVRAKVLASRGETAGAERLTREAVARVGDTQILSSQADAYVDLAEVLLRAGKQDEAKGALEEAIARYVRKGNVVGLARARALAGYEALAGSDQR